MLTGFILKELTLDLPNSRFNIYDDNSVTLPSEKWFKAENQDLRKMDFKYLKLWMPVSFFLYSVVSELFFLAKDQCQ